MSGSGSSSFHGNQRQHQHLNPPPSQPSPSHLSVAPSRPPLPHWPSSNSGSDYSLGSGDTDDGTPSLISPSQDSRPSTDDESHSVSSDPAWDQDHIPPMASSSPLTPDLTATTATMTSLFASSSVGVPAIGPVPGTASPAMPPRPMPTFYHPSPASIESLATAHLGSPALSPPAPTRTNPFRPSDFLHQPFLNPDPVPHQSNDGPRWAGPSLVAPVSIAPEALRRWVEAQQRQEWERQVRRNLAQDIGRRARVPAPPYSPTPSYSNLPPPSPTRSSGEEQEQQEEEEEREGRQIRESQESRPAQLAMSERPPFVPSLALLQPSSSVRRGFRSGSAQTFREANRRREDDASDSWPSDPSSSDQDHHNMFPSTSSAASTTTPPNSVSQPMLQRLQRCLFLSSRPRHGSEALPSSSLLPFSARTTPDSIEEARQHDDEKNEKRCSSLLAWSKTVDSHQDALPPSYEFATGSASSSSSPLNTAELGRTSTVQQQRRRQCVRLAIFLLFLLLVAVIIAGIVLLG